jgi:hypothetical protein
MDTSIGIGLIILNILTGVTIIGALGYVCVQFIKNWPEK